MSKDGKKLPAEKMYHPGNGDHVFTEHRDTGVSPITAGPDDMRLARSRGYVRETYRDVISHCNKLSRYDREE